MYIFVDQVSGVRTMYGLCAGDTIFFLEACVGDRWFKLMEYIVEGEHYTKKNVKMQCSKINMSCFGTTTLK